MAVSVTEHTGARDGGVDASVPRGWGCSDASNLAPQQARYGVAKMIDVVRIDGGMTIPVLVAIIVAYAFFGRRERAVRRACPPMS